MTSRAHLAGQCPNLCRVFLTSLYSSHRPPEALQSQTVWRRTDTGIRHQASIPPRRCVIKQTKNMFSCNPLSVSGKEYVTYVFRSIQTTTLQYMTRWWFQTFFLKLSPPRKLGGIMMIVLRHFGRSECSNGLVQPPTEITENKRPERSWLMLAIFHVIVRYCKGVHVPQQNIPDIYIYIYICIMFICLRNDVRDLPKETTSTVYFVEAPGI